jgi:hypothetical protein
VGTSYTRSQLVLLLILSAWKGYSPKFALTEFSSVHIQRYAYPWPYTITVVDLSEPTFGRLRVRTLPRLINTGLVREREEDTWAGREIGRLEAEGKAAGGKVASDTSASEAGALKIVRAILAILAIRARRCRSTSSGTGLGNTWRA